MTIGYDEPYSQSIDDKETFWARAAEDLVWTQRWQKVLDDSAAPFYRWFVGGELNTCYNAVDRHVEEGPGPCSRRPSSPRRKGSDAFPRQLPCRLTLASCKGCQSERPLGRTKTQLPTLLDRASRLSEA